MYQPKKTPKRPLPKIREPGSHPYDASGRRQIDPPSKMKKTSPDRLVPLRSVIDLLIDYGYLQGNELIPHRKPTHGPCCTCQTCGHSHDGSDCACSHNELLKDLLKITDNSKDEANE